MRIYEFKYLKECEYIMIIEAKDEKEAQEKFEEFDCIKEYEHQCIHEELIDVHCDVDGDVTMKIGVNHRKLK